MKSTNTLVATMKSEATVNLVKNIGLFALLLAGTTLAMMLMSTSSYAIFDQLGKSAVKEGARILFGLVAAGALIKGIFELVKDNGNPGQLFLVFAVSAILAVSWSTIADLLSGWFA